MTLVDATVSPLLTDKGGLQNRVAPRQIFVGVGYLICGALPCCRSVSKGDPWYLTALEIPNQTLSYIILREAELASKMTRDAERVNFVLLTRCAQYGWQKNVIIRSA